MSISQRVIIFSILGWLRQLLHSHNNDDRIEECLGLQEQNILLTDELEYSLFGQFEADQDKDQ